MSKTVKAEELAKEIAKTLEGQEDDIEEDVVECVDSITKQARDELKQTSPRGKGKRKNPYHKGWAIKVQKKGKLKYHKVVWNKTNYQLTHLLEFGHATKNGGRTRAITHIRPVEEKYNVKFVDLLESKIKGR